MKAHSPDSSSAPSLITAALVFAAAMSPTTAMAGPPPPWSTIARIGLVDARHTAPDGWQASDIVDAQDTCFVLGVSDLYLGEDDVAAAWGRPAQTAWIAGPTGQTHRVGLYDAAHTRDDGRHESRPLRLNRAGVSVGESTRFSGHRYAGTSAWVATATGATLQLGFYDAAHRATDGSTRSAPIDLNGRNKIIGVSENPETGQRTGWIANTSGQINPIGLTDAAHTADDGHCANFPVALNDQGYVVGNADFFAAGEAFPGATAWVRRPDRSMRLIGFQAGVHRAASGQHVSRVESLTESGYMAGWSTRYAQASSAATGQTAWVTHVDGPNRTVGFYTGVHLGATGSVHSHVERLNDRGYAAGMSFQYDDAGRSEFDQAGATTWIATPDGSMVRVGLYDAEHSVASHQFNEIAALNGTDAVIGSAARYRASGEYFGNDAFVANAAGYTTKLALIDAPHTRGDGYHASYATAITDSSGFVAGYAERFSPSGEPAGRTAWVYARSSRTFLRLEPSVRAADHYAESTITDLREDGAAFGYFRMFATDGADLGERAFAYLPGQGIYVIEEHLSPRPTSNDWDHLAGVLPAGSACLAAIGIRNAGDTYGHGVYLLSTEVAP